MKRVKKRKKSRNYITEKDFEKLNMYNFLKKCYDLHISPCSYGNKFSAKLIYDNPKLGRLGDGLDRGDCHINYKIYFENKISFRHRSGTYRIANIRDWQDLDYFILCFVDTEDKFKPQFYCVPKKAITDNIHLNLTGMNNTRDINEHNEYVATSVTINPTDLDWLFRRHNKLKGTSYKDLQKFLTKLK